MCHAAEVHNPLPYHSIWFAYYHCFPITFVQYPDNNMQHALYRRLVDNKVRLAGIFPMKGRTTFHSQKVIIYEMMFTEDLLLRLAAED